MRNRIPLDQVAEDQREVIRAFREAGEKSYQDYESIQACRESSDEKSISNGLPPDPISKVTDVAVGDFTVRVYDNRDAPHGDDAVIVYAHGGGWVMGSLDSHDPVCRRLVTLTDLPVVSIGYRLAPEHPFPVPYTDSVEAVAWVRDHSTEYGWSAQRVVVAGDSSGGSIAAGLAAVPSMRVEATTIIAQVLLYSSFDLMHETKAYERISAGFPLTAESIRWFAGLLLADSADRNDPRASPLPYIRGLGANATELAPAYILALGLDPLGDEDVDYALALIESGTEVQLDYLPHHTHSLVNTAGVVATGEKVIARAADFIKQHV